jgi:molybdopterin converting factor small subunit
MIKVVFLGRLKDLAGDSERFMDASTLDALIDSFVPTEPELHAALKDKSVRVALNLTLLKAGETPTLNTGDEIAFMPPFSGG